jgi:hypothetical protein
VSAGIPETSVKEANYCMFHILHSIPHLPILHISCVNALRGCRWSKARYQPIQRDRHVERNAARQRRTWYVKEIGRLESLASLTADSIFRILLGIFFKYDIEPMSLTIEERTTSLIDFLVRLAGIVGGILVCSNYAWRGEHSLSMP